MITYPLSPRFAVFIAPIIGTLFILSGKEYTPDQLTAMPDLEKIAYLTSEAQSVKMPYMILGGFLIVLAIIFYIMDLPEIGSEESKSDKAKSGVFETLKYNHVRWAVIAQFFYVGAQVCVTSFFIRMAISGGGVDEKTAGWYLSAYGLLFMIGRFVGSAFVKFIRPAKLLSLYSFICILLSLVAIFADGKFVVLALGGLGFFMSIMFPTIFSLGIEGLKEETKPASSLIVMAIIGGAIFPVIMGGIIDSMGDNIQIGYIVPFLCFFVVWYFGWKGHKVFINPVESLS